MPLGTFINLMPMPVFVAIHLAALVIGAYFAKRSFDAGATDVGRAFTLYALAELSYLTYHLDWTVFLFAHTISEVFDLVAFVLLFVAIRKRVLGGQAGGR
jgi:uncharacterized membrane protein